MAMKGIHKAQNNLAKTHSQPHGGAMKVAKVNSDTGSAPAHIHAAGHTANSKAGKKFTKDARQGGGKDNTPDRSAHASNAPYKNMKGSFNTGYGVFTPPSMSGADCFRGTSKKGVLRVSGSKGAHMLGCKK